MPINCAKGNIIFLMTLFVVVKALVGHVYSQLDVFFYKNFCLFFMNFPPKLYNNRAWSVQIKTTFHFSLI